MYGLPKVTAGSVQISPDTDEVTGQSSPAENTVRVDLDSIVRQHEGGDQGDSEGGEGEDGQPKQRHDRTLLFALNQAHAQAEAADENPEATPTQDRHDRTQLYAMSRSGTTPPADDGHDAPTVLPLSGELPGDGATAGYSPDQISTLPPDAPFQVAGMTADAPAPSLAVENPDADLGSQLTPPQPIPLREPGGFPAGLLGTEPGLPPMSNAPGPTLDLPPEPLLGPVPTGPMGMSQTAQFEAVARDFAESGRRRNRLALAIIALAILAVLGLIAWKVVSKKFLGGVSASQMQELDAAVARLRRDDSKAKQQAIDELNGLLAQQPEWVEGRAGLVLALSLQYDDLQQRIFRYAARHTALTAEITRLEAVKPEGWSERRDVLAARANQLKKDHDAVTETAMAIRGRLQEADRKLQKVAQSAEEGSPAHLAMLRSRAMVMAVFGQVAESRAMVEAWTKLTNRSDDWVDLVGAEATATQPPDSDALAAAILKVEAVRKRELNSTFLRPYVLLARLKLAKGDREGAQNELDAVLNLDREHDVAQELLDWTKRPALEK